MHRLNWLFTLSSVSVLLVTVERFSGTTRVILQPDSFLSLHQLLQTGVLILLTAVISVLLFWELSGHFSGLRKTAAVWLLVVFAAGVYLYGAGEGLHELASYYLTARCDPNHPAGSLCRGLFINDFYTGNVLFFVGAFATTAALLVVERMNPNPAFTRGQLVPLGINAVVYAATVVAYAAFDTVLVGLVYTLAMLAFTLGVFLPVRKRFLRYPFASYTVAAYTLGAILSVAIRLLR
jgi:hypothetical protein